MSDNTPTLPAYDLWEGSQQRWTFTSRAGCWPAE
jgi:hypothetical protein